MQKKNIFKKSSTTYYYSSLFFPVQVWEEVATLYAYVRTADNYVDQIPADKKGLLNFISLSNWALSNPDLLREYQPPEDWEQIVIDFALLVEKRNINPAWIVAFLKSMASDLPLPNEEPIIYSDQQEYQQYVFGSAEVIGLFLCKILDLPEESYPAARAQGAAMQHINFIRDIAEDCQLQRQYLPLSRLKKFGLDNLCDVPHQSPFIQNKFKDFIRAEIKIYQQQQKLAAQGFHFLPYRYRVPVATAAQLYNWTAQQIYGNPLLIFEKKIKPSKTRAILTGIKMIFLALKW